MTMPREPLVLLLSLALSGCGAATGLGDPGETLDGGFDAGVEASRDVGVDTGVDTGVDASSEASVVTCAFIDASGPAGITEETCGHDHACVFDLGCIPINEPPASNEPLLACGDSHCAAACNCTESLAFCDCTAR